MATNWATCGQPFKTLLTARMTSATLTWSTNVLIANVLASDLDLFNADGEYAPTPHGSDRDSFSIGIGLTAVGAVF